VVHFPEVGLFQAIWPVALKVPFLPLMCSPSSSSTVPK
jgi:hypothetical protein